MKVGITKANFGCAKKGKTHAKKTPPRKGQENTNRYKLIETIEDAVEAETCPLPKEALDVTFPILMFDAAGLRAQRFARGETFRTLLQSKHDQVL